MTTETDEAALRIWNESVQGRSLAYDHDVIDFARRLLSWQRERTEKEFHHDFARS